jgi:hypothetical protein
MKAIAKLELTDKCDFSLVSLVLLEDGWCIESYITMMYWVILWFIPDFDGSLMSIMKDLYSWFSIKLNHDCQ